MIKQPVNTITFDASGKTLGRLASEVAVTLRGKRTVQFMPNKLPGIKVIVNNINRLVFSGNKLKNRKYYSYSGYPGGLKITTLEQRFTKNPVRLFREAVRYMLPKNRLSAQLLRNLVINKDIK